MTASCKSKSTFALAPSIELIAFVTLFTIDQLPTTADQSWWIFLIILVPISIIGSLLGTWFNKKMNNKGVQIVYMATTVAIIIINIYLIIMSSIALA